MRLAAIDIGTNSLHMIVVRVRPDLSFEVIDREKEMVRLGAGGLDGRALTPEAMHAALQVLSKFRRLAESHRVDEIIAVATSATREAENGGEFLRAVAQQTGIRPRVISGTEEARLIHLAAVYGVSVPGDVAVVIDIGGGSVEITRGTGASVELGRSFKLGVIRAPTASSRRTRWSPAMSARWYGTSTRSRQAISIRSSHRIRSGHRHVRHHPQPRRRRRSRQRAGKRSATLRNRRMSAKQLRRIRKDLVSLDLEKAPARCPASSRGAPTSRSPARCSSTRSSAAWAPTGSRCAICRCAKAWCSTTSRATASRSRRPIGIATCAAAASSSSRSAATTGRSTRTRSRGSPSLFEQTRGIHGLTDREREWLEYAALCTTSASTSATSSTTSTRITSSRTATFAGSSRTRSRRSRSSPGIIVRRRRNGVTRGSAPSAGG